MKFPRLQKCTGQHQFIDAGTSWHSGERECVNSHVSGSLGGYDDLCRHGFMDYFLPNYAEAKIRKIMASTNVW